MLEGPLVAVNRQLPKEHPIYDLLKPHLEGTALINWGAQNVRESPTFPSPLLYAAAFERKATCSYFPVMP